MKTGYLALLLAAVLTASGCSLWSRQASTEKIRTAAAPELPQGGPVVQDRFGTKYLAYQIFSTLRHADSSPRPIIITTFVDLNDLNKTSVFGRMIAERLIDDMNRQGFNVVEMRRGQDVFVRKDLGEFILTRDISELAHSSAAHAVLAGTYVVTSRAVIINARLIDIRSPQVLSTVTYEMALTDELEDLVK